MADLRLGGGVDPGTHQRTDDAVAVPSDELTTHGVIVGMTGSGKTGLGVVLIEEALSAGVPALLIDPDNMSEFPQLITGGKQKVVLQC